MKIGYKATDENMYCKQQQYELGKEYMVTSDRKVVSVTSIGEGAVEDKSLRICSSSVIHYCNTLEDCFKWYSLGGENRYFKVRIKGRWKDGTGYESNKSCTDHIEFLEEVSKEELDKIVQEKEDREEDDRLKLNLVRDLQNKFPNLIVGGSLALYLQGARLRRLEVEGCGDLDLIHPFWVDLKELDGVAHIDAKNSGNTFDETFTLKGVKLDLSIEPNEKYKIVEFKGNTYKVNPVERILEFKCQYARQKNGQKHKQDIYELIAGK
ncbi:MAG: hypothetical protein CMH22_05580 [Methylophaga sp.]|nr:hypothetical protein [Methylophaga sp.]|tara:strand:+ start:110445 stop:111242 length:798 start_codon:yes stop_codon:yes gene_type:complete